MSGALLARFIFLVVGTALLLVMRWPYPVWLKAIAILIFTVDGALASRSLNASSSAEEVKRLSRWLLAVDTTVTALLVYLYLPLYHDVWTFMLLLIVFGSTQDPRAAAFLTATVAMVVVIGADYWPASGPVRTTAPIDLAIEVAVIAMSAAGVEIMYRSLSRGASVAKSASAPNAALDAQTSVRLASDAQAERMQKVIDLAIILLRERELAPLLDRILEATMQTFGFRCGAIMTAERGRQVFAYRSVRGYPPEQQRRLMVREVPFAQMQLKIDPRFLVRPSAYYAPVERQSWHTDPLTCFQPEAALLPRERRDAWHEADTLAFTLSSSSGEIIGILCPDAPVDGRVPSAETIDNVAMFARLAAAVIENVYLASMEPHREVAERVARILDLTAAIFVERDLDRLLQRILSVVLDTFGFNAGTILLRDGGRDAFVRRAALGFPREVEGKEVSGPDLREMMNERTKVRDTFYYAPMELNVAGGVTRDPNRAILPRVESGQWHENDLLLFPIFNSSDELIGVLTPDDPKDRRVPAYETIQALEVFARIAGLAIETALIRSIVGRV